MEEPVGDIQFYDNDPPDLAIGKYRIDVTQTITFDKTIVDAEGDRKTVPPPAPISRQQLFTVTAPCFALGSGDIHAKFPPANSQGHFDQTLPHIVLTQRSLPWVRSKPETTDIPWLALLVLAPDEIDSPPAGAKTTNTDKLTHDWGMTVGQLQDPEAAVVHPTLDWPATENLDMECRVIYLDTSTFTAVTPRLDELKYLAHVRQVNTGDKVIDGLDEQGWFSVVVANRLPSASIVDQNNPGQPGNLNIVHLVSLEGLQEYMVDAPNWSGKTSVRLISLARWVFTCQPTQGQSFKSLMTHLIEKAEPQGTSLLFKFYPQTDKTDQVLPQVVSDRLDAGYVPLGYRPRTGEKTFAWYRGPFVPNRVARFRNLKFFRSAGEAVIYDPTTGIFDQSYSVAWQIGRQLALSDKSFALNLLKWRRQSHSLVDLLLDRLKSPALQTLLNQKGTVHKLNKLLDQQLISKAFLDYLVKDLQADAPKTLQVKSLPLRSFAAMGEKRSSRVGSHVEQLRNLIQPAETGAIRPLAAHKVPASTVTQLQNLLQDKQVQKLLISLSDPQTDPTLEQIILWLAKLRLLYDVPFEYLAPSSALLPSESIRFFYVDPNWIDSAIDGALSIGVQSKREELHNQIMRPTLKDSAKKAMARIRTTGAGIDPPTGKHVAGNIAGLLLRSAVVSGWPGLQVRAFAQIDTDGKTPISPLKPLRTDRLSPDVLLCLWSEVPGWIEFDEPAEGFHFGFEDDKTVRLRSIDGTNYGHEFSTTLSVTAPLRTGSTTVLDIKTLVSDIESKLPKIKDTPPSLSPATFALQMVATPEQLVLQNLAAMKTPQK